MNWGMALVLVLGLGNQYRGLLIMQILSSFMYAFNITYIYIYIYLCRIDFIRCTVFSY